jgi:protein-L-isoaspartate(D-aspartate) O-methyltransferase
MHTLRQAKPLIEQLMLKGINDERVLAVMGNLPREHFLPPALTHQAYQNDALPIGQGQTLSQPSTVAFMTQTLLAHMQEFGCTQPAILEIGTGSGYQTAILAKLFDHVYTVERIKALQFQARRRLKHLDCYNVSLKHGDGWEGWASKGPFNGIIVTAAARTLPLALVDQLAEGGCMLIPLGEAQQTLTYVRKYGDQIQQIPLDEARFVPLIQGQIE